MPKKVFRQVGVVGLTDKSFAALRNAHYSHPISPNTPVLTVSTVVLWISSLKLLDYMVVVKYFLT